MKGKVMKVEVLADEEMLFVGESVFWICCYSFWLDEKSNCDSHAQCDKADLIIMLNFFNLLLRICHSDLRSMKQGPNDAQLMSFGMEWVEG